MKLHPSLAAAAPVAMLLAFSSIGTAGTLINATFGFTPIGTVTADNVDLLAATTVTLPATEIVNTIPATAFGNPNDLLGLLLLGDSVTLSPLALSLTTGDAPVPNLLLFSSGTSPANRFSFSASTEHISFSPSTRAVSLYFLGTFHDGNGVYDDAPASLTISLNQSAAQTTINASGTFSSPPSPDTGAPEPATLAMMGSALVGLGVIGRKRFAR